MNTGWQIKPVFLINLHEKDKGLLELIKTSLGVGKIFKHGENAYTYRVSSIKDIVVLIKHFDNYPLITQKLADYILFKQAIELINKKEHLTKEGLETLVGIKASLNLALSENLKSSFPKFIPAPKLLVES